MLLEDRRVLASWAADCAERALRLFELEVPGDGRPRVAIERARAFSRGEVGVAVAIRQRLSAGRAARMAVSPAAVAAARGAGQAEAVAHMGAHALGAAAYAARAVALTSAVYGQAMTSEIEWQLAAMRPEARAALARLPRLREASSGPLGPGLLRSESFAPQIRSLQAAVEGSGR